jgi:hypothetical protein
LALDVSELEPWMSSVVVDDLDVIRACFGPPETDLELIVNAIAVPALSVTP